MQTPETWTGEAPARREAAAPVIYVPLDGSDLSLVALPVAKALAELEGATLHLVHVAGRGRPEQETLRSMGLEPEDLFGSVVDELEGETPDDVITELAARDGRSRIVLAAYSVERPGHELGPVAEGVLSKARCPVLLVRPERGLEPWDLRRLLVPHDGSPQTARALLPAIDLADSARASVIVLHVANLRAREPAPGSLPVPTYVDQPQHEWPEWSREFLERMEVCCRVPERLHPRLFLAKGEPGPEILRFATEHQADLLAIAWHGSFEPEHARTAKELILRSPCPVLFVRTDEQAEDWEPARGEPSVTADLNA